MICFQHCLFLACQYGMRLLYIIHFYYVHLRHKTCPLWWLDYGHVICTYRPAVFALVVSSCCVMFQLTNLNSRNNNIYCNIRTLVSDQRFPIFSCIPSPTLPSVNRTVVEPCPHIDTFPANSGLLYPEQGGLCPPLATDLHHLQGHTPLRKPQFKDENE